MNKKTTISYVVPLYNTEVNKLDRCVSSIKKFSKKIEIEEYEIIVINDKSDKSLTEEYKKILMKEENVIYVENEKNYGVSYSRNIGIKRANKQYIMFVDSDDYLTINYMKDCKLNFTSNMIIFDIYIITKKKIRNYKFEKGNVRWDEALINHLTTSSFTNPVAKLYQREFLIKNNIEFDTEVIQGEDNLFNIEFLNNKPTIYYYNFPIYVYEFQSKNTANRWNLEFKKVSNNIKSIYLKRLKILNENNFKNKEEIKKRINNQLVQSSFGIYITLIDINDNDKIDEYVKQFLSYKINKKDLMPRQRIYYNIIVNNNYILRKGIRVIKKTKNRFKRS